MKGTETHDGIVPAIGEIPDGKIEKKKNSEGYHIQ